MADVDRQRLAVGVVVRAANVVSSTTSIVSSVRLVRAVFGVCFWAFFVLAVLSVSGSSVPLGAEPISISRRSPTALFCFDVQRPLTIIGLRVFLAHLLATPSGVGLLSQAFVPAPCLVLLEDYRYLFSCFFGMQC